MPDCIAIFFPASTEYFHLTRSRKKQPFKDLHGGCFSGTIWSKQPKALTSIHLQIQSANRFDYPFACIRFFKITANNRWCGVDWLTMESVARKEIHVLGDSTLSAPLMPKSGHMANQHGKIAAAAITALMTGRPVNTEPVIANTCYSFTSERHAIHVASVHRYDAAQKTLVAVPGSGGISAPNADQSYQLEHAYAEAWARNVWADMLS